jgi:hypothetical protein
MVAVAAQDLAPVARHRGRRVAATAAGDLPGGHPHPQDRAGALGVTTGHVGCWPTSWAATARSPGCGPSTTSNPDRPRPSGSHRPGAGGQSPRRGRVVPGAVGACDRAVCGREVADPGAGAHPAFPPPRRRCPPTASARSRDSPRRLRALPMTGWAGERPACPHLRKLASKALLYRCAASRAASCRAAGCRERLRPPWSSKCPGQGPYSGRGRS